MGTTSARCVLGLTNEATPDIQFLVSTTILIPHLHEYPGSHKRQSLNMRTSSTFAASAFLLSLAQARIAGVSVPSTIKAGDTFTLIIRGTGYIQTVTDVSIAVGYFPGETAPLDDGLGIFITAFDLGT